MLEGVLATMAVGLVWVVIGSLSSKVADRRLPIMAFFAFASGLAAIVMWLFWVRWPVLLAREASGIGRLLATMSLAGALLASSQILTIKAMQRGHKAIAWAIGQSAMALSFLAAVLIWHDPIPWTGWLGLGCVLVGVVLLATVRQDAELEVPRDWGWVLLVVALALVLAAAQVMLMLPSRWTGWEDVARLRVPVTLSVVALVHASMALVQRVKPTRELLRLSSGWAAMSILSYSGMFYALDKLADVRLAGIFFPLGIGVCIFGFTLYSKWRLREPLSALGATGIAVLIVGIGLLAIG